MLNGALPSPVLHCISVTNRFPTALNCPKWAICMAREGPCLPCYRRKDVPFCYTHHSERGTRVGFQPGNKHSRGRPSKEQLYGPSIRQLEDFLASQTMEAAQALVELATGQATEQILNLKTGELVTRRLAPDGRSAEYIINRILGKPESRREIEMHATTEKKETFQIIVGPAADEHRAGLVLDVTPAEAVASGPFSLPDGLTLLPTAQDTTLHPATPHPPL